MYADPLFALIAVHIPFNPDLSSPTQLSDERIATQQEVALLFPFDESFAKCPKGFLAQLKEIAPALVVIVAQGYTKNEFNSVNLIERKISWGAFARRRKIDYEDTVQKVNMELARIQFGNGRDDKASASLRLDETRALQDYDESLAAVRRLKPAT